MDLRLVFADTRPDLRSIWTQVFQNEHRVSVVALSPTELRELPDIGAELLPSYLVHDRFGGRPVPGKSQILSAGNDSASPPWVVTTPPMAAHFEWRAMPSGVSEIEVVQDLVLSPEDELHYVFTQVFGCIAEFQTEGRSPAIRSLGVSLKLLNTPRGDPEREAQAVLRAYREHTGAP